MSDEFLDQFTKCKSLQATAQKCADGRCKKFSDQAERNNCIKSECTEYHKEVDACMEKAYKILLPQMRTGLELL
ncbi:hypothetical protein Q1695_015668 [Nippostrongylus brasiliensis]|nr:hypothetical protein Q1695_015668 [Nippostrongylus brasiliensis]